MRNSRLLWTLVLLLSFIALATAQSSTEGPKGDNSTPINTASSSQTGEDSKTTDPPKETGDDKSTGTKSTGTSTRTRTTRIPANAGAGGVSIIKPALTDGFQYYPIKGTPITWSYNYTSVLVPPTAVNIGAFCSRTQQYYTIAHNYSYSEKQVVWDTKEYVEKGVKPALAQETYNLIIFDSNNSRTSVPSPGHLGPFSGLQFALYEPKGPTPWSEWECPTCNAGSSLWDSHSIRVLMGTAFLVTLSFAWFVHGAL